MARRSSSSSSSSSTWRYLNPAYYLKRPKRLALLFMLFVCATLLVWDRQTLVREHQVFLFFPFIFHQIILVFLSIHTSYLIHVFSATMPIIILDPIPFTFLSLQTFKSSPSFFQSAHFDSVKFRPLFPIFISFTHNHQLTPTINS